MRQLLLVILISIFVDSVSQILPGMDSEEIGRHMMSSHRDFVLRNPPNVDELDFIKYEHVSGDKTLIVFVNEKGYCTFTRLMVDIDYLEEYIAEYEQNYESAGDNLWIAIRRGEEFSIAVEESEWTFSVTVRPKDNTVDQ